MGNPLEKPKLQTLELINKLEWKGIKFNEISKDCAIDFLNLHNNYFKPQIVK